MAEPKTKPTHASVAGYLDALPDARVRADCRTLVALMSRASGTQPVMWGTSIIGFGSYRYTYVSGTTGDWPLTGFAPRAKDISVYLMDGLEQRQAELSRLGPHKHSTSCLYLKSLDRIDLRVLEAMVADSVKVMRARWPAGSASAAASSPQASAAKKAPAARKASSAQKASAKIERATKATKASEKRVGAMASKKAAIKSATKRKAKPAAQAKSAAKSRARR